MNLIQEHIFPDHKQGGGLEPFELDTSYETSGDPVDLSGATILMQLRDSRGRIGWEFSTLESADTVIVGTSEGVIQFPNINSWDIKPTNYSYDLKIIEASGFVRYVLTGTWKIVPSISKEE